jgi:hypothetical protein
MVVLTGGLKGVAAYIAADNLAPTRARTNLRINSTILAVLT